MTQLSKEQLLEIIETDHVQCGEASAMARCLLAAEAQEPVAWRCDSGSIANRHVVTVHRTVAESWVSKSIRVTPLYAAPQPFAVQEPVAWINEDELPESYPYDRMFPYSKVDIVRMFPVYGPQPVAVQKPVRYLNKFSDVCVTAEQQPDAATDPAVYQPLYTEAPAVPVPDLDRYRAIVERCCEILHGSVTDVDLLTVTVQSVKDRMRAMETSELLSAMEEVLRISDRQHDAWGRVRAGIAAWKRA